MDAATWFPHGWVHYLGGGVCIGLGVALIFVLSGHVAGMSTVFSSTWSFASRRAFFQQPRLRGSRTWRLWLALGLVIGAALFWWGVHGATSALQTAVPVWQLALGGFLVGYGARRSGGCTSGHGICGLGSLQWPSLLAVLTFMATAIVTANVVQALGGR
ncbi:MAG: YeeE/YedE thiosulfate transporter family protein [Burkholderiales bacterium]